MNVLISVDMEGISGVVTTDHVTATHKEYDRFRKLMTADTNAAIEGALAGGATRVVVNDSHGGMANILLEELNPAAELISGSPKPLSMMEGIGPNVDAVFFVGYHSRMGTGGGVLAHTYAGSIVTELRLNGQAVGETGLNAAVAGAYGVPVVLVTGDRAVTEEARALLGDIETVAVKEGVGWKAARCLHPDVAHRQIREAAERAMRKRVAPFVVATPVEVRAVFQRLAQADIAALIPGSRRTDGLTLEFTAPDMETAYRTFRAMVALAGTV
jgi:D-amino peptidase